MKPAHRRQLAVLTAVVLAVHVVLLEEAPLRLKAERPQPPQFATRFIVQPPAPVEPAPPRPVAVAPAARPQHAPPPRVRTPPPPAPAPAAAPSEPPAAPPPEAAPPPPTEATAAPPLTGMRGAGLAAAPAGAPAAEGATPYAPQVLAVPDPAHIHFDVRGSWRGIPVVGQARLDWRHDGQQYEARFEASGFLGRRVERSSGRITDQGLAPEYYAARGTRSEQATHFDRDTGHVVFSNNQPQALVVDGMQDRLSVVVQLSVLVAGDPARFQPGTEIAIPTADTREAQTWIFGVQGEEDLDLPGGRVRALKLQRLPRKEFDQKVELWLAPAMDYAPVRLRLTNPNGDTVDQRWSSTDKG